MSKAETQPATSADGRTARRERNRELVLDTVLELFAEGSLEPGAPEVAQRSGVSLRSVYRYFDDTDALIRAAIARNMELVQPLFEIDDLGKGPLADRIDRLVTERCRLYQKLAPMMRATLRRAPTNEILRENLDLSLRALRHQIEQMFAPELGRMDSADAREVAAGLDILLGFQAFEHLTRSRGLADIEVRRILARSVAALLNP